MRILVYGAGVIGSVFAAKLQMAPCTEVTILARGERLEQIDQYGIVLEEMSSGEREITRVNLTDRLEANDAYDWVIVTVRKNQIESVLPPLAANLHTPNIVFLVNNAAGAEEIVRVLGPDRVVLGFPGAGGTLEGHVIKYRVLPFQSQPTTLGELNGKASKRLRRLLPILWQASIPATISHNIDAWLKTHVAIVSPIANALYAAGGDNYRLAHTRDAVVLMVRAIREGFAVLRALDIPIEPPKYRILLGLPEPLLVAIMQRRLATPGADLVLARHARHARDEMQALADEFLVLAGRTSVPTPALDMLDEFIDPASTPLPEGAHALTLDLRGLFLWIGSLIAGAVGIALLIASILRLKATPHEKGPAAA